MNFSFSNASKLKIFNQNCRRINYLHWPSLLQPHWEILLICLLFPFFFVLGPYCHNLGLIFGHFISIRWRITRYGVNTTPNTWVCFGFALLSHPAGLDKKILEPLFHPIRSKAQNNHHSLAHVFLRFARFLQVLIGSGDCVCPLWMGKVTQYFTPGFRTLD